MSGTFFNPPRCPIVGGLQTETQARILRAEFGDGYAQRGADGLNGKRRTVSLTWRGLTTQQHDEIDAFFAARGGHEAFTWIIPGETVARKWTVEQWSAGLREGGNRHSLNATLREEFDLD